MAPYVCQAAFFDTLDLGIVILSRSALKALNA
jgi:hypothetical protein